MASITKQFTERAAPPWAAHPLYRSWRTLLDRPNVNALSVSLYRPREGLTYAPAKLYVSVVTDDGTPSPPSEYAWDPVANAGLIHLQARCSSQADEVMRFALMARAAFIPIEGRVGDGYFNSVFLGTMRKAPFTELPKLSAMLGRVSREYSAQPGSALDETITQLENAIGTLSEDLTAPNRLDYPSDEADEILDGALAQYVDERFNVTNRELLGW